MFCVCMEDNPRALVSRLSTVHATEQILTLSITSRGCSRVSEIRARGYKTFFMLNSVEHEILNARKYKNI